MAERLEDRLRAALDLATEDPPLRYGSAPRLRPEPRRKRVAGSRLLPVLVVAAVLVAGIAVVVDRDGGDGGTIRQATGPAPSAAPSVELATAPAPATPTSPRAAYPEAPTVAASPLTRAMLAFGFGDAGHWTWFVVDATDAKVRSAADVPTASRGPLALSPDGRRLAYALVADAQLRPAPTPAAFVPQVVVVDLTDGRETRIAADGVVDLSWSPDGSRLAWIDGPQAENGSRLVVAQVDDVDSGRRAVVAMMQPGRRRAVWSPDGRRIAVAGCKAVLCPASILDPSTMTGRELAQAVTDSVAWTPDGAELIDASGRNVIAVQVDGSGQRTVTNVEGSLFPLADPFSPDGTRVLLRPPSSGLGQAYSDIVDLAGGRLVGQLIDAQEVPYLLGWKGDAAALVAREEPGVITLYRVPLDGSGRRALFSTTIRSEDFSPSNWVVADWFTRS